MMKSILLQCPEQVSEIITQQILFLFYFITDMITVSLSLRAWTHSVFLHPHSKTKHTSALSQWLYILWRCIKIQIKRKMKNMKHTGSHLLYTVGVALHFAEGATVALGFTVLIALLVTWLVTIVSHGLLNLHCCDNHNAHKKHWNYLVHHFLLLKGFFFSFCFLFLIGGLNRWIGRRSMVVYNGDGKLVLGREG